MSRHNAARYPHIVYNSMKGRNSAHGCFPWKSHLPPVIWITGASSNGLSLMGECTHVSLPTCSCVRDKTQGFVLNENVRKAVFSN